MKTQKNLRIQLSIIISLTILTCTLFLWFSSEGITRVKQGQNLWDNYTQQSSKVTNSLRLINNNISYAALNDYFTENILRSNPTHSQKNQQNLQQLRQTIADFQQLDLSNTEQQALLTLIKVINQYEDQFDLNYDKAASGMAVEKRELQWLTDQSAAYKALNLLQQAALQRNINMQKVSSKTIASTVTFLLFGTILIPVLLIISGFLIHSLRQQLKANNRIEAARELLYNLVEAIPDAIISIDKSGSITHATSQTEHLFGYCIAELQSLKIKQLMPDAQKMKDEAYCHHFSNDKVRDFSSPRNELLGLTKEGLEVPLEVSLRFVKMDGEQQLVAIIRDISSRKANELSLRKSQLQLAEAQRIAGLGNWEWIKETQQLICSEQTCLIFGAPPGINRLALDAFIYKVHPEDRARVRRAFEHCIDTQTPFSLEHRIDGADRVVHIIGEVCLDKLDKSTRFIGTVQDITKKHQAEQRILQSSVVFENTSEGVIISDKTNKIIAVNKAYSEITGYQESEVLGKDPGFNKSQRHNKHFYKGLWQELQSTGRWKGELWDRRKNGESFPKWVSICAVKDNNDNIINYIAVFSDITHIKQSEQRLEYLALHDPLTDLPNRMLFSSRLEYALQNAQRNSHKVAVLFIDLDRFKEINDTLGHLVGDTLLQQVAQRLLSCGRSSDTIARLGGDEFTIIIEQLKNDSSVDKITNKILTSFKQPFQINEQQLYVSASIGVSSYPEDGENVSDLVKNADTAMYQAKESGRAKVAFYNKSLTTDAIERFSISNSLHQAIREQQFELHYQPQVALKTNRIVGVEALARWNHPEEGMISPARFIPVAEEHGQIEAIGSWALLTACRQVKAWEAEGLPSLRMSVNVSGRQISAGGLVEKVEQVLRTTALDPQFLTLEVTESAVMTQAELAIETLNALKKMGVGIAIDDFGTGYSSLAYLKRFNIDKLKIDRSFVIDLPDNKDDAAIARAIMALSHSLELSVIAEGVETEEQRLFMQEIDCEEMQGFLFSRPLTADDFAQLWRKQHSSELISHR